MKKQDRKLETTDRLGAYLEIEATKGKMFSALFVKANGELRRMNCRIGVKKGVVGTKRGKSVSAKRKKKVFCLCMT